MKELKVSNSKTKIIQRNHSFKTYSNFYEKSTLTTKLRTLLTTKLRALSHKNIFEKKVVKCYYDCYRGTFTTQSNIEDGVLMLCSL